MDAPKIHTKKGFDLPIEGGPDSAISTGSRVRSVALLGRDYRGLKPRMMVEPGDRVALGDPLFTDKRDPAVVYAAPGSGTVAAVNRGERRSLLSVVVDLEEEDRHPVTYPELAGQDPDNLSVERIREVLQSSGLWTAFRGRPYSRVPLSSSAPRSIFVTATDTNPLAVNPNVVVADKLDAFEVGLSVVARLTDGPTYLCTGEGWPGRPPGESIRHAVFTGPHPAGLVGTHIHHLDPVSATRTVWHIGYQDVIAIGTLFTEGCIATERIIALGGPAAESPRLLRTRLGASGRAASAGEAFLGRYHLQVSALLPSRGRRLLGWLPFRSGGFSVSGLLASREGGRPEALTTRSHGRATAMMPVNAFDELIPMDILTTPLLRALLTKDTDQAQALGCLELDAEDLALCSFACAGKNDYGTVLNVNLAHIEREG